MSSPNDASTLKKQPAWPRLTAWLHGPTTVAPVILTGFDLATLQHVIEPLALVALCPGQHKKITPEGCTNCRLLETGNHPDCIRVSGKSSISIKQIRLMRQRLATTPLTRRRLIVIEEAEKLSTPAVNALLKTLEEPGPTTRFVLLTTWPRRLPATIRSRAQIIRLTATAAPQPTSGVGIWSKRPLERLRDKREGLTDEELTSIAGFLAEQVRTGGTTSEIRRAYQRLRDYHVIKQSRGNTKVAADVLLASLPAKPVRRQDQ